MEKPGVYEYPLGTNLKDLIEYAAGGVKDGKKLKAVIPGGLSSQILKADEIDLDMDFDSCVKANTMLGSGGIIVMDEDTFIPDIALTAINFYVHESCGQCTPCRDGLAKIQQILKNLINGNGKTEDIDTILNLAKTINGITLCPLGEVGAVVIESMIEKFRDEFESLVK